MGLRAAFPAVYGRYFAWRRKLEAVRTRLPPPPAAFDPGGVRRALLICTGLIGDSVMCLPAIRAARELLPRAELVGLVTERSRSVLKGSDALDRFLLCDGAPLRLRSSARRATRELRARLGAEGCDLAVIFLGDDYAPMLTRLGIPHRVFVAESAFGALATATYSIGSARTWGPRERLDAWRALGLEPAASLPSLRPDPAATSAVTERFRAEMRPWITVHPFGSTTAQWWPLVSAEAAARALRARLGGTVFLLGGPSGEWSPQEMVDLVGKLTLDELIALVGQSDCVISTDSGPYHLAGALGRPGVGLFRASRPEYAGRYPTVASLIAPGNAECRAACRWDRCAFSPCRQMEALAPETVVTAAAQVLDRP